MIRITYGLGGYDSTKPNDNIVEEEWLGRYPWPTQMTFDRGSEFIGHEFQTMIKETYGITL